MDVDNGYIFTHMSTPRRTKVTIEKLEESIHDKIGQEMKYDIITITSFGMRQMELTPPNCSDIANKEMKKINLLMQCVSYFNIGNIRNGNPYCDCFPSQKWMLNIHLTLKYLLNKIKLI